MFDFLQITICSCFFFFSSVNENIMTVSQINLKTDMQNSLLLVPLMISDSFEIRYHVKSIVVCKQLH